MTVFNHVGIAVSDADRSRRFYEGALDFRFWYEFPAPDETTSKLLGLPSELGLRAVYLVRDGLVLELLHFTKQTLRPAAARTFLDPGLTHISLSVDDFDTAVARVREHGGSLLEEQVLPGLAVMVRDPDGQFIELTGMGFRSSLPPLPSG